MIFEKEKNNVKESQIDLFSGKKNQSTVQGALLARTAFSTATPQTSGACDVERDAMLCTRKRKERERNEKRNLKKNDKTYCKFGLKV